MQHQRICHVKHIHLIGIGGAGMGGIAEVLWHSGFHVSGSDLQISAMTEHLRSLGITVFIGHAKEQIQGSEVVVISSAITQDNPEVIAAQMAHIPILPRAEMLAELMRFHYGIAIAGTHGKTTVTSLLATMLAEAGHDPTYLIGGKLNSIGGNAYLGQGKYFVAEADESDQSFLYLHPMISVVTNIDADHLVAYNNDFQNLQQIFVRFIQQLPFYGLVVLCLDDPGIASILPQIKRPMLTYGAATAADLQIVDYFPQQSRSRFTLRRKTVGDQLSIDLNLVGWHNVLNASAVIAVATDLGLPVSVIQTVMDKFSGVDRRLQIHPQKIVAKTPIMLIDDYGHHPTEIAAVITTIRESWPERRLVMVYQPHRYTRTAQLFDELAKVLSQVDWLILLDIYSASELPILGITSERLAETIKCYHTAKVSYLPAVNDVLPYLPNVLQANDVLLVQGAGDIADLVTQLLSDTSHGSVT